MKNFKPSKMLIRTFIMTLLSLFLLVGVSFAWYYSKISIGGGGLTTGTIGGTVYGYDASGTLKSTVDSNGDSTTVNTTIFAHENWKAGDASTAFIAVKKKSGSIDIEFNISFSASGYDGVLENFMYLGGYWYEISEITDVMSAKTDAGLKTYAAANKVVLCSTTQCPNNRHTCTEKDGLGNYKNMNTILTTKTQGVIKTGDSTQIRYYRIDYGVRKDATPEEYTNKKIELIANVYVTQVGAIQNPEGVGVEYTVSTEAQLKQAIIDSVPGDTIVFAADITYTGDLTINKALNLNLASKTLTVKGNLTYNFTSAQNLKINLSGTGTIKVLMNGQGGGNFTLDTPNAQVEIIGTNTNGDLIVERICTLSGSNNPEKGGCVLSGVTIIDTVNESKEVYLRSDSKVTVSDGSTVKRLETRSQASNIQIVNNGVIESINLGSMFYSDMTDFPQVYIINHGLINGLVLPTWSEVFRETNGIYSGNTKVVCSNGGVINNLMEVNGFKNSNIVYEGSTVLVESIDGSYERLRVHYKNKAATTTTLEGLLREYFTSEGYESTEISGCIAKIIYLEIVMLSGKYFTSTDSSFVNSSFSKLETLNLENANFANNNLPSKFITAPTLKEIILPKNLQTIETTPFGESLVIRDLVIPESVTAIAYKGLTGVRHAYFQSVNTPSVVFDSNSNNHKYTLNCGYVFAPEAVMFRYEYDFNKSKDGDNPIYIAEYVAANNKDMPKEQSSDVVLPVVVYPQSLLADDGVSYVRQLSDGTYELVLLDLDNNPDLIVDNKYVVGKNITLGGEPIVISQLGRYSLRKCDYSNLDLSFDYSITTAKRKVLCEANIHSVDFSNIQTFDVSTAINGKMVYMKFTNTKKITTICAFEKSKMQYVEFGPMTRIEGTYAFKDSEMVGIDFGSLTYCNSGIFKRCKKLKSAYGPNIKELRSWVFQECVSLIEARFPVLERTSGEIFKDSNALIYLNLGSSLANPEKNTLLDGTPGLKYLYIGGSGANLYKLSRLVNSNPAIDYIFVAENLYNTFYSAVHASMKDNLREYGTVVGDYKINAFSTDDNPYYITVGDYTVRQDKGAIITSCNYLAKDMPKNYEIPKTLKVNGSTLNVVGIGRRAFANTSAAPTSFNNVTTISEYAFYNCDSLKLINAPNLTEAKTYAFAECDNLGSVIMPNATSWGDYLFYNCPSLSSIYMGKSLSSPNTNCISGTTTNVKKLTITFGGVASTAAFTNIASKNVDLYVMKDYVAKSEYSKFNVIGIDKTVVSDSNTYCLSLVSGSNYEIVSISLGNTTLVIPSNAGIIRSKAGVFDSLAVTSITLPSTYKSVAEAEFSNVIGLTEILVTSGNTNYVSVGGVLYAKSTAGNKRELICYPNSKTGDSYTTESDTVVLSNSAFKNVKYLKTVNITSNVNVIGEACFENSSMSSITFASTTAPYITSSNVFNTSVTGFKIYVPSDSYKTANGFSKYVEYIVVQ